MTGRARRRLFLKRLREWGVHRIYGYPGDGINGFLGALDRADGDPDFIQARHEEMAAFMACGHAKFTGDALGVCIATSGPARSTSSTASTTRSSTTSRSSRSSASRSALARRALPAGGRPPGAVQGRRRSTSRPAWCRSRRATSSTAPSGSRSTTAASARSSSRTTCRAGGRRVAAAHARLRLLERRLLAPARSLPQESDIEHAAEILNEGEKVAMLVGQGARGAADESSSASPTCSAPASPRRCSARTCSPTTSRT